MLYKKSGTKEVENIRDILILVGDFNFWGGLFIGDWFQTTMYTWLLVNITKGMKIPILRVHIYLSIFGI